LRYLEWSLVVLKRKLFVLAVSLCAPLATTAAAEDAHGKTARDVMIASINHAIVVADIDGLTAQYRSQDAVEHALAAMAIERVHGNFEQSSSIAGMCESSLKTSEPFVAHYCAWFAAANLRLMGERQKAAIEEESIAERYKGVLPAEKLNSPDLTQAPLYKTLPPVKVSIPAGITSIPLKRNPKRSSLVEVTVNGTSLQLVMDTGGYSILGEETARKLGVKVLLEKDGNVHGALGGASVKKLGLIEKLKLGNVEFENLPVSIIDEERNIIGMDALQRLGAFEVQKDAVLIYGEGASKPTCETPLLLGTTFWGSPPKVLEQVRVDGVPQNALFDTGTTFYLTSNQPSTQGPLQRGGELKLRDVTQGSQAVRFARKTSNVEMAGKNYQVTYASIEDLKMPYKFILGEGSLIDVHLFVDFKRQVSCLLPRFPEK
jgi:clan AA aspartic protease (TIGR02281 family)